MLLIVEIAASSIDYDRGVKLALYARHEIPELWIVDLDLSRVEVHRTPDVDRSEYRSCSFVEKDGGLEIANLAGVSIPAAQLLG